MRSRIPEFEDTQEEEPEGEEAADGEEAPEGEVVDEDMFWAWDGDGALNDIEDEGDDFAGDDAEDFVIEPEVEMDPEFTVAAAPTEAGSSGDAVQVDESQAMVDPDPIIEGSEVPLKDDPASLNRAVARPLARLKRAASAVDVEAIDLRGCRDEDDSGATSSGTRPSTSADMIVSDATLTREQKVLKLKDLLAQLKALEEKADDAASSAEMVATEVRESLPWISSVWFRGIYLVWFVLTGFCCPSSTSFWRGQDPKSILVPAATKLYPDLLRIVFLTPFLASHHTNLF